MSSQAAEAPPELQVADQTESYPYKGYDDLNKPLTNAAFNLIGSLEQTRDLLTRRRLDRSVLEDVEESRYLHGSAEFLHSQGMIDTTPSEIVLTKAGVSHLKDFAKLRESVRSFEAIMQLLKGTVDMESDESRLTPALRAILKSPETAHPRGMEALLPAAVTFFHEARVKDSHLLSRKREKQPSAVYLQNLITESNVDAIFAFTEVLRRFGLARDAYPYIVATPKGEKIFQLGGYAELILSYYSMFQRQVALTRGELSYGLKGDVNRDAELNANASNGILNVRVAPHITSALSENNFLKSLGSPEAYIDYGSGGGDMLMQVAENGPDTIQKFFGIDINPATNEEARRLLAEAGIADKTHLISGSITDPESLKAVQRKMTNGKQMRAVASINFILHDIGPDLSRQFLKNHAQFFPNTPLIITETLRMPSEVLRAHPHYQAASFQYMHKASGQHLYDEAELRALLKECDYTIEHEQVHSSMPSEKNDGSRLNTIVTYIGKPNGA